MTVYLLWTVAVVAWTANILAWRNRRESLRRFDAARDGRPR